MKLRKGFTLIELLIVIAIILILIAIALPNFMAARLRAKVTETAANMKTVDTAMNFCASDYPGGMNEAKWLCANQNTYLGQAWNCDTMGTAPGMGIYTGWVMIHFGNFNPGISYMGSILSTPVQYIESCPLDFFNTAMESQGSWPTFGFPASFHIGIYIPGALDGLGRPWQEFWNTFMPEHPEKTDNFVFHLNSAGPDVSWWNTSNFEKLYSPTNGTRSTGDIWRWSNGLTAP